MNRVDLIYTPTTLCLLSEYCASGMVVMETLYVAHNDALDELNAVSPVNLHLNHVHYSIFITVFINVHRVTDMEMHVCPCGCRFFQYNKYMVVVCNVVMDIETH